MIDKRLVQLRHRRLLAEAEVAGARLGIDALAGRGDVDHREVVFLETAFGLLMRLVHARALGLAELIAALTCRPAGAWGLPYGSLSPGAAADVVVLDPDQAWVVDPERFLSKGKNSPLGGQTLRGTVLLTIADGNIVYRNGL